MTVRLLLESTSEAKVYENVDAVYQKNGLICIASKSENWVHKYPISKVFRIEHPYNPDKK